MKFILWNWYIQQIWLLFWGGLAQENFSYLEALRPVLDYFVNKLPVFKRNCSIRVVWLYAINCFLQTLPNKSGGPDTAPSPSPFPQDLCDPRALYHVLAVLVKVQVD